ncbi:hypothetical protein ABZP36_036091 [Zizania latifolia]
MELIDMVPADAIALRLYSLPAAATTVGSLWAWLVAALAAAFGLWRIRAGAAGCSTKPDAGAVRTAFVDDKQPKRPRSLPSSAAVVDEARPAPAEAAELVAPSPSEPSTPCKVRFTAYYGGSGDDDGVVDGVRRRADRDDNDDGDGDGDVRVDGEGEKPLRRASPGRRRRSTALLTTPWEEREMAVRWRGDLGWYRHLDMSALDGSVVRLWDGEVAAATASPGRLSRRAGSELHLSL